ncbi:NUDIX domain-containing protein [Cellulomonas sp. P24]|uniref:NUDIX domain-containing protein n=1 Tax=Cellulomonas sp. P24 TaxID=2885206 RepID=UPI00216B4684|nr:NUDIX domain-containing protein [Cellulomonas sp. P24]MCR6492860.1 NUDIX domain-containing protein [Cellulomonas sp. P24]
MSQPRPLAVAVIRHPRTGAIFVDETTEPGTGRVHHRAVGGGIEFGELAAQTLVRELREEYGIQVTVGAQLGVLENLFVYQGQAGHELVVVHEAEFASSEDYSVERTPCNDDPDTVGTWRPREGSPYPLYPDGLDNLMSDH